MKIEIDKNKILSNACIWFRKDSDYIEYIKKLVDNLAHDNKNYSNRQYNYLLELSEIVNNFEVIDNE